MIAPVLKFPGSKHRLAPWIVGHMPPHRVYVEPYCGSAAVFLNKPPAELETINDINGHVVNLFRVIRERPEDLAAAVEMTPWAREEYDESYDRDLAVLDPAEAARRFLVRTWQGHGSAADRHRNGWRVVRDQEKAPRRTPYRQWQRLPGRILAAAERLRDAQVENRPALEVIAAFDRPGALLYCDPPYVLGSVSPSRKGRKIYDHQMTDGEHAELLATLERFSGMALLSGYPHHLYDEALVGWGRSSKIAATEKGGSREECLWINPRAAEALGGRLFA